MLDHSYQQGVEQLYLVHLVNLRSRCRFQPHFPALLPTGHVRGVQGLGFHLQVLAAVSAEPPYLVVEEDTLGGVVVSDPAVEEVEGDTPTVNIAQLEQEKHHLVRGQTSKVLPQVTVQPNGESRV